MKRSRKTNGNVSGARSGSDFCGRKLVDEPLPIIFLPAYGDIPTSVRSANTDAVDFRTKPIQKEALLRAVSTALAAQAKRRLAREQLLA